MSNTKRPRTLEDVAHEITERKIRRIVLMTGAGVSTYFRSKDTGLYANLQKYNLPFPEAIFELNYFKAKPNAFFRLARELYPGNFAPTLTHCFFALLEDKGLLLRCYSQNIDCLDLEAGVSPEKLVEAHGSFATATCLRCKHRSTAAEIKPLIEQQSVVRCERDGCKGRKDALIKPDIVFFGEGLPDRFHQLSRTDFRKADLLIVLGTSLQVYPFAGLVNACDCPKVLINLEKVPSMRDFDVKVLKKADEAILEFADLLGWKHELELLKKASDKKFAARTKPAAADKAKKVAEEVKAADSAAKEEDVDALTKAVETLKVDNKTDGKLHEAEPKADDSVTADKAAL